MIPNGSTPIKNEILMDIFAKGKLTQAEIRIVSYVIRWSWGFMGKDRRQDWTKKLTKRQMANDIEMKESLLNRILNKMIKENKIIVKGGCYQFNEHEEEWKNLTKSKVFDDEKLNEKLNKTLLIVKQNLTNSETKLNEKLSSTGLKVNCDKGLRERKETIKETIKEKGDIFSKTFKDFKIMRNKIKKPLTKRAETRLLTKLNKLSDDTDTQVAILEQSIFYCWQDVYPIKDQPEESQYVELH